MRFEEFFFVHHRTALRIKRPQLKTCNNYFVIQSSLFIWAPNYVGDLRTGTIFNP